MANEQDLKVRFSDAHLTEFKELILAKIDQANKDCLLYTSDAADE